MTGLLVAIAALVTSTGNLEVPGYQDAYRQHKADGRPLVVLIGADWCPGCRVMKGASIPAAIRDGVMEEVAFAVVDVDQSRGLADRLMRGGTIPQLVMYYQTPEGPRRRQLTGAQDVQSIREFVASGVQAVERTEVQAEEQSAQAAPANTPTGS